MLRSSELIVTFLWISFSGGNSKIVEGPVDTEVKVGDSTYLNCSLSDVAAEISWFHYPVGGGTKYHRYVYYGGLIHPPYDTRFLVQKVKEKRSVNLVIMKAEIQDAGLYVCQNGGSEKSTTAELIILGSDPVCATNIQPRGFVGPNSCGLDKDTIQLSCDISYKGNIPPNVQWTRVKDKNYIPIPESQSSCRAFDGHIVCNHTADSAIDFDGSSFSCHTSRSRIAQYNCTTDVVRILYAFGEKMPTQRTVGDVVTCSAQSGSLDCNYTWIWSDGGDGTTMSENERLIITKNGWHRCQANCYFNQYQCSFDAMAVLALFPSESSTSPVIIAVFATFCCCCVTGLIIAAIAYVRWQKRFKGPKEVRQVEIEAPLLNELEELLITDGGQAVAPKPIEDAVKEQLPCISNCMLVGNNRKFLSILLTFKVDTDLVTSAPLDKLSPVALQWCQSVGSNVTTASVIAEKKCKPLVKAIKEGIDRVNSKAITPTHVIKKWTILQKDFSISGGELDPTMKVYRSRVERIYSTTINSIYDGSSKDSLN